MMFFALLSLSPDLGYKSVFPDLRVSLTEEREIGKPGKKGLRHE